MKNIRKLFAKRGFPLSLEAFRACSSSYSQFGEDMIVQSLFSKESPAGFYLDLGCYRPIQWSNTYYFYRRGWRGLSVDASGLYQNLWRKYRPRDRHIVGAVIPTRFHQVLDFVESMDFPATSKIVVSNQTALLQQRSTSSSMINNFAISDLADWWPYPDHPSIVSSDLEGLDYELWMHFPFSKFKPRVLILEQHNKEQEPSLLKHLHDWGYEMYGKTGPSLIFCFKDTA